jgi:hypothetical protein
MEISLGEGIHSQQQRVLISEHVQGRRTYLRSLGGLWAHAARIISFGNSLEINRAFGRYRDASNPTCVARMLMAGLDAPNDDIAMQLKDIVALVPYFTKLFGVRKPSQNNTPASRDGIVAGRTIRDNPAL